MRTLHYSLLIAALALFAIHCGGSKPVPDAFRSMEKNKMVRIGTNPFNPPFESAKGTGVEGFDVDLGEAIAKDLGYPTKWIPVSEFDKLFDYLANGELEMVISSVAITPEREKDFAFSVPYFDSSNTIARRRDNMAISDLASLTGKKVGVQIGRAAVAFMEQQTTATGVQLAKFQTLDDALGALNRGDLDAVVGDKNIMTYTISNPAYSNLITTDVDLGQYQYGVVVRKNETMLLDKINETIRRLKNEGQLQAWTQQWFGNVMAQAKEENKKIEEIEKLKASPKTISVGLIKEPGNQVQLDMLDGFSATLTGPNGSFTSTPLASNEAGTQSTCKFTTPVPPGEYRFNISAIHMSQQVTVAKEPVTALKFTLTFQNNGKLSISWGK